MGFDDENLKPNKRTKKGEEVKKINQIYSYEVNFYGDVDIIRVLTYEELLTVIAEKYNLSNIAKYRIEVWSDLYKEWLHMVSLPANTSKIRILTNDGNVNNTSQVITGSALENCSFFSEKLNVVFKEYIHADNPNFLSNFEKAVVFGMKRYEKKNMISINEDERRKESITAAVTGDLLNLKSEYKKIQMELDNLNEKLLELEMKDKSKIKLGKVKHCTVL